MRKELLHPHIAKSETFNLIEFTIESAKKYVAEPPGTVGLSFCSAASHDVSYVSLFTAMELAALKPWLVSPHVDVF